MDERHENEQYFFDEPTLRHLVKFSKRWSSVCCICAPMLGAQLSLAGVQITLLDIDRRFETEPGFRYFDLNDPSWLGLEFDLIICDPPFFNVSLSRLYMALRVLARHDASQRILVSYLERRSGAFVTAMKEFDVQATGYFPGYVNLKNEGKNRIVFFSNLTNEDLAGL